MAETKAIKMQKRNAMGERITGLKKGGAVREPAKKKSGMSKGKKGC